MIIVQYVTTKNDINGNRRRGWQIHELAPGIVACPNCSDGERGDTLLPKYLGYVDEGCAGPRALSELLRVAYGDELPDSVVMPAVEIKPGDHRDIRNGPWFVDYADARSTARHQARHGS
jgi:hypothetical protein